MLWESMKFSFHHRAFYCYLVMTLWIIFLVSAMCKYIGGGEDLGSAKKVTRGAASRIDLKLKKIISTHCRPADEIKIGSEGAPNRESWSLEGLIVVTRHGDRGPLTHLRGGDSLPCNTVPRSALLQNYSEYVWNATAGGRAVWVQGPGPFHNFPTLPVRTPATSCALGQLTLVGVNQMLVVGSILKAAYAERLGWNDSFDLKKGELVSYSTRYRRTFQSALAVLFALVPRAAFPAAAAALREAHSVTFCFRDCVCMLAGRLARRLSTEERKLLNTHPAILELVHHMSEVAVESPVRADAHVVRDALLASLCHQAALPCSPAAPAALPHTRVLLADKGGDFDAQMEREKLQYYRRRYVEHDAAEERRDDDFNFHMERDQQEYDEMTTPPPTPYRRCISREHAATLMSYTEWTNARAARSAAYRKRGALEAYGFIRHMVRQVMGVVSSRRPRVALYSAHDRTLRAVAAALGLPETDAPYSSRFIIEVYRRHSPSPERLASDFYIRAVHDGSDVTERLSFCRGWHNMADGDARLCPVENLVRFIHDDYFAQFNATNYKDACAPR